MRKITLLFAATAICSGVTVTAASAVPIAPVPTGPAAKIEQVRWVCGPYRCWWRPNYYRGYYGYAYYPRRHYWHRRYW